MISKNEIRRSLIPPYPHPLLIMYFDDYEKKGWKNNLKSSTVQDN